ncbi:hypothetical protein K7432_017862 [Basidiobolus ranarum]|uniref:Uncharacterized protein n=1 Tax=Basidiobolus ranarum TaxID=34480 RepID=A0ABR2WCV0_9FUNG
MYHRCSVLIIVLVISLWGSLVHGRSFGSPISDGPFTPDATERSSHSVGDAVSESSDLSSKPKPSTAQSGGHSGQPFPITTDISQGTKVSMVGSKSSGMSATASLGASAGASPSPSSSIKIHLSGMIPPEAPTASLSSIIASPSLPASAGSSVSTASGLLSTRASGTSLGTGMAGPPVATFVPSEANLKQAGGIFWISVVLSTMACHYYLQLSAL